MRRVKAGFAVVVLVLAGVSRASASSITFSLNCSFAGAEAAGACENPGGPFGTVTLSDDAADTNWLDLTVNLALPASPSFVLKNLYLNTLLPQDLKIGGVEYEWVLDATISKIEFKLNDLGPSNVPNGSGSSTAYKYMDIRIEPGSSVDPWTGVLKLQRKDKNGFFNLDPDTFNFTTNDPSARTPVYLGLQYQLNSQPSFTQVAVGSLATVQTAQVEAQVPEPGTFLLLGTGLGLVRWHRRRRRE